MKLTSITALDVDSIEGKQLDLCKSNIIFSDVDCFCLQEKRKMKPEVFCVPNTSATASAMSMAGSMAGDTQISAVKAGETFRLRLEMGELLAPMQI